MNFLFLNYSTTKIGILFRCSGRRQQGCFEARNFSNC